MRTLILCSEEMRGTHTLNYVYASSDIGCLCINLDVIKQKLEVSFLLLLLWVGNRMWSGREVVSKTSVF